MPTPAVVTQKIGTTTTNHPSIFFPPMDFGTLPAGPLNPLTFRYHTSCTTTSHLSLRTSPFLLPSRDVPLSPNQPTPTNPPVPPSSPTHTTAPPTHQHMPRSSLHPDSQPPTLLPNLAQVSHLERSSTQLPNRLLLPCSIIIPPNRKPRPLSSHTPPFTIFSNPPLLFQIKKSYLISLNLFNFSQPAVKITDISQEPATLPPWLIIGDLDQGPTPSPLSPNQSRYMYWNRITEITIEQPNKKGIRAHTWSASLAILAPNWKTPALSV